MTVTIVQQAVGKPIDYDVEGEKPWTSSIAKTATAEPLRLDFTDLAGNAQADLKHHGGPDMAVLVYAEAHYDAWRDDDPELDFPLGAFGENWTVRGQDEQTVCLGDIYDVGTARVQVCQPRQPCWKIARRWDRPDLVKLALASGRLGWYLRVLETGTVTAGDALRLAERPLPDWTIAEVNDVMFKRHKDRDANAFLAQCDVLPAKVREQF
ncbi:MAG: MOSC domain-containing protein, partial [Planctomycetota bacterium]